jgi:hypothetical protein
MLRTVRFEVTYGVTPVRRQGRGVLHFEELDSQEALHEIGEFRIRRRKWNAQLQLEAQHIAVPGNAFIEVRYRKATMVKRKVR